MDIERINEDFNKLRYFNRSGDCFGCTECSISNPFKMVFGGLLEGKEDTLSPICFSCENFNVFCSFVLRENFIEFLKSLIKGSTDPHLNEKYKLMLDKIQEK